MKQFFQKGSKPNQLVVAFHGTGGNEYQLLTTIATLYPEASVLSYLGTEGVGVHVHTCTHMYRCNKYKQRKIKNQYVLYIISFY